MKSQTAKNNTFKPSPATSASLLKRSRILSAKKGQVLVERGEAIGGVFWVLTGHLTVYSLNSNGREATLYRLAAGEICLFSLRSAMGALAYPAWVRVDSRDAQLAIIRGDDFKDMMKADPALFDLVIQCISTTVRDLMASLDTALLTNLRERLHNFLVCNAGSDGRIEMTHSELARHLGSSREVISREIAALKKQGVIRVARGNIEIATKSERALQGRV
jgi:CRP/FNR family transcriptional regulator, anaerobic regulatory protein